MQKDLQTRSSVTETLSCRTPIEHTRPVYTKTFSEQFALLGHVKQKNWLLIDVCIAQVHKTSSIVDLSDCFSVKFIGMTNYRIGPDWTLELPHRALEWPHQTPADRVWGHGAHQLLRRYCSASRILTTLTRHRTRQSDITCSLLGNAGTMWSWFTSATSHFICRRHCVQLDHPVVHPAVRSYRLGSESLQHVGGWSQCRVQPSR